MKGIMLKEPLFNKVIEERKDQTRRVIKSCAENIISNQDGTFTEYHQHKEDDYYTSTIKPRYKIGERVYLKEPYCLNNQSEIIEYKFNLKNDDPLKNECNFWKNKMFMPEKYARYFIDITDVRVERLQDISCKDVVSEGLEDHSHLANHASKTIAEWETLWDSINKTPYAWEDNPFVWVYEFKLVK